jgi:hypothetical protein
MRAVGHADNAGVRSAPVRRWLVLVGLAFLIVIVADLVLMFTLAPGAGY